MTNEQIVFNASLELMEAGVIGTTGKILKFIDAAGNEFECNEPEPIHTFAMWKSLGYKVKKGSKAIAKFAIWTYKKGKKKDENEDGSEEVEEGNPKMYLKDASWFSLSQVERVAQ